MSKFRSCIICSMPRNGVKEFHPYAACSMFKVCHNSRTVHENLRAVVEYGMEAERAGVSLDRAMNDITWTHVTPPREE